MAEVPVGTVLDNVAEYRRHRPDDTLLYQIIAEPYPTFAELMRAQGRPLPGFVQPEFEGYLNCGRLEYGFIRVRCAACHAEKLVAFSAYLQWDDGDAGPRDELVVAAVTYRLAVGPQRGQRAFTLQTLPPDRADPA